MNMKTTLRRMFLVMAVCIAGSVAINAATIYYNNVKYTTSGSKATVAKYDSKITDGIYKGDIVIPEKFTDNGVEYTVVATGANAFKDCVELTSVIFPETLTNVGRATFSGCTALTNFPLSEKVDKIGTNAFEGCASITEAFVPAGVTAAMSSSEFAKCTSLKKFTIKDGETAVILGTTAFGASASDYPPLEEIYIGRNLDLKYGVPFAKMSTIKKATFGDGVTSIVGSAFVNCTNLETVIIGSGSKMTEIGNIAFQNCSSLTSFTVPLGVTAIGAQTFQGCSNLSKVEMHANVTSIGNYAFSGCKINLDLSGLPMNLKSIGSFAFNGAANAGTINFPSTLERIGEKAFVNSTIENVTFDVNVSSIGDGAFAGVALKSAVVAADNQNIMSVDDIVLTKDGKTVLFAAAGSPALAAKGEYVNADVEVIKPYAFSNAPFTKVTMVNLKEIGTYAFQNAKSLESFDIAGTVNINPNIFEGAGLKSITFGEGIKTIPNAICKDCTLLASVVLPETTNVIMLNAFSGCTSLKKMEFGKYLNYLEAGAVPATIEEIVCKNVNVPIINETLFNESQSGVICKVAEVAVNDYKDAAGWKYLNIQGDATIVGEKAGIGCPSGLYFATKTGRLMFKDVDGVIEDTGIASGLHAFQLGAAHDRIYVGYAGARFTYSGTPGNEGEGEVFYLNKSGESFYRVTLVSNIGYNAFQDPFSLSVDVEGRKLLVADRNVGIHYIDTERPGLYGEQPFFLQNNWLPYYGKGISYGAIGCGIYKDSEGVYWMGKKFNGNGIFRFRESDISESPAAEVPFPILFEGTSMTTFYLDEPNGYLYAYLQAGGGEAVPGVYRVNLSDIKALNGEVSFAKHGTLIDDAPVNSEGSAPAELTGITQISGNGDDIYWSYIAPKDDESKIPTSVVFDPENPLHKSGIKTISAKGGAPVVTYAVTDVEAYGCVAAKKSGSGVSTPSINDKAQNCVVKGSKVELFKDAKVTIVALNGAVMARSFVAANSQVSVDGMANGLYIIHIAYTDGTQEVVKVIR